MREASEAEEAGQNLAGRRLLVVLGSYRSKRHIFEHARDLGVRLVVVDGPGHWAVAAQGGDGPFECFLAVDISPVETFPERAAAVARATGLHFDGIGVIDEFAGGFASRIASLLGLSFHSIASTDLARDKHRTREACVRAGIPSPRFARIASETDFESAANAVGFPAVLKPVSGVGSVQAYKVKGLDELRARFAGVQGEVTEAKSRPIHNLRSDRDWFQLMWARAPHMTLESWIEGQKYDVDLLLESDRLAYAHATDDLEPCGIRDVRRIAPADLDSKMEQEIIAHATACVRAIGFRHGAFNVEVKRTADGPRMIEVNGRLGGYSTTDIHKAVWDVDLVEQWLRLAFGLSLRIDETQARCFAGESLLPSPRSGVVAADGFLESVKGANVIATRQWCFRGDAVAGVETGAPDWLGAIVVRGTSREQALDRLQSHVDVVSFPVK